MSDIRKTDERSIISFPEKTFERFELEQRGIAAKLDNLDRSIQELSLTFQQSETARKSEFDLTKKILEEDRNFSKALMKEERDVRNKGLQKEIESKEINKKILMSIGSSIWEKGGQWIVAALCIVIVMKLQSCSGIDLTQIFVGTK